MTVFSPMDSWIAAAGRSDASLSVGLDLLDRWQGEGRDDSDEHGTGVGQAHLVAVLAALHALRPVTPEAPDPLVLAVWFHHAGATAASVALQALGDGDLAVEVERLVRQLGLRHADHDDANGCLLHAAHRAAVSATHLAAVPPVPGDQ
ncbi:hypothetical protein acdb102_38580 [Acidothermaceae bacterium B102]|nr:hypothetical protein acdb102_38580 [Acidothermaceae bacterium B102]